jgi:hypothetical protein
MQEMLNEIRNDGRSVDMANTVVAQLNDRTKKKPYLDGSSSLPVHCYKSYGRTFPVTAEREGTRYLTEEGIRREREKKQKRQSQSLQRRQ